MNQTEDQYRAGNRVTYGEPSTGCYLDHVNYNSTELSVEIIELAEGFGFPVDDELRATMEAEEPDCETLDFGGSQAT